LKEKGYICSIKQTEYEEDRQYAKPFEHDGRTVYKIGVNFSTKTRRIEGWKIQTMQEQACE